MTFPAVFQCFVTLCDGGSHNLRLSISLRKVIILVTNCVTSRHTICDTIRNVNLKKTTKKVILFQISTTQVNFPNIVGNWMDLGVFSAQLTCSLRKLECMSFLHTLLL